MKLPIDYDNKDSENFIPEELRKHYEELPPVPTKEVKAITERYARAFAAQSVEAGSSALAYWEQVDQVMAEGDTLRALHVHYLNKAAERQQKAIAREELLERKREESICPICLSETYSTPSNPLRRRSLTLEPVEMLQRAGELHSCLSCYLVAMQLRTQEALTEKLGKKTRLDLVADM
jgi:hypothetical protein